MKTLDFKIYLGLLTETYNDAHQADLKRTGGVPIDMVVVNLYPFKETIAKADVTPEQARGNIDIGGPCMIRASAKNFIRVASVVDPGDYAHCRRDDCRQREHRWLCGSGWPKRLSPTPPSTTAAIAEYLAETAFADVEKEYQRRMDEFAEFVAVC